MDEGLLVAAKHLVQGESLEEKKVAFCKRIENKS